MQTVVLDFYGEITSMAEFKPYLYPLLSSGELKMFWEERSPGEDVNYELSYKKLLQYLRRLSVKNWQAIVVLGVSEDVGNYDEDINPCRGSLADQITRVQHNLFSRLQGKLKFSPVRVSYIVVDPVSRQGHTHAPSNESDKSYLHWEMDTRGYTVLNEIPCTFHDSDLKNLAALKPNLDFSNEVISEGIEGLSNELRDELMLCCNSYIDCVSDAATRVEQECNASFPGENEYLYSKKAVDLNDNFKEKLLARLEVDPQALNALKPEIILKELLYDYYSVGGIMDERSCCVRVRQADFSAPRHNSTQFRVGVVILLLLEIGDDGNMLDSRSFLSLGDNIDINTELAGTMLDRYLHALESARDSVKVDSVRAVQGSFALQRTPEFHFEEPKSSLLPPPPLGIDVSDWKFWWEDFNISLISEQDQYKSLDRENVFQTKRAAKNVETLDVDNIETTLEKFKEERESMKRQVARKAFCDFNLDWKNETQSLMDKLIYRTEIFSGSKMLLYYGGLLTLFVLLMLFLGGGDYQWYMLGWCSFSILIMIVCYGGAKVKLRRVHSEFEARAEFYKGRLSEILKSNMAHLKKQCEFAVVANNYRKLLKEVSSERRRKSLILYHANKVTDHIELMRPLADIWKTDVNIVNSDEFIDKIDYDRPVDENIIYSPSTYIPGAASYNLMIKRGHNTSMVTYFPFELVTLEEDGMFEGGKKYV
ncbi:hypothetical protein SAMN05660337_2625 [Maridesulfovibrio ferrireducens]|uniref:Uncharacterized protein n=1 Tax=Maridesulfovibrio ferrireducens TaxID=246191 RepID=A0A1G9J343_9BACT|nr:hypothetical protein [Maridesulfovibrio ferrireducens]SDL31928.1 hypothetical protein SAMN05660337_2625 [Maridesulfovibrio ferrireducens]